MLGEGRQSTLFSHLTDKQKRKTEKKNWAEKLRTDDGDENTERKDRERDEHRRERIGAYTLHHPSNNRESAFHWKI